MKLLAWMIRAAAFSLFLLAASAQAADLHLFVVGDTVDAALQEGVAADMRRVEQHAAEIAYYTGMSLKRWSFAGNDAAAAPLRDSLAALETQPDDVVFFYFSGHGFRTPSKEENPWPNLYFTANQSALDLLDIASILREKDAHLTIVFADCCNNLIAEEGAPSVARRQIAPPPPSEQLIRSNYAKLFLHTDGQIIASSSKAGQFSYAHPNGGFFSKSFFATFNTFAKQVDTALLDWHLIFSQSTFLTKKEADKIGASQEPLFLIQ